MTCSIVVQRFFEDYMPVMVPADVVMVPVLQRDGTERMVPQVGRLEKKMERVDFVVYCPSAQDAGVSLITRRVKELIEIDDTGDVHDFAQQQARERRDVILPAYENWKRGSEAPTEGWPLAQWASLTKGEADILRHHGFRTVEDIATAPDHKLEIVSVPSPLAVKGRAIRFLASRDQGQTEAAMAEKDAKMAAMQATIDQLKEMMEMMLAKPEPSSMPAKPAKGRGKAAEAEASASA